MEWNEIDIEISNKSESKLISAMKRHNILMQRIVIQRNNLQTKLNYINRQEKGQGQRGEEVESLKISIKKIDTLAEDSGERLDKLIEIRNNILLMYE